jgi:hypothetical protein
MVLICLRSISKPCKKARTAAGTHGGETRGRCEPCLLITDEIEDRNERKAFIRKAIANAE